MGFLETTDQKSKAFGIKPATIKQWSKFVVWVQYKPYRDAIAAEFDEAECLAIKIKCALGKVTQLDAPKDWNEKDGDCPDDKLVEVESLIAPDSEIVRKTLITTLGAARFIEICTGKDPLVQYASDSDKFLELITTALLINGIISPKKEDDTGDKNPPNPSLDQGI